MRSERGRRVRGLLVAGLLALSSAGTVAAQGYDLFDKLEVSYGYASNAFDTKLRLDSKQLGIGTEIDFEDTTGLDESKGAGSVQAAWQVGRRHRLAVDLVDLDRSNTGPVNVEFQFGDLVVPVDAVVSLDFGYRDYRGSYTFYPLVRERTAFGIVFGVRYLDIEANLRAEGAAGGFPFAVATEEAQADAPLPFLGFELRNGLAPKWRLVSSVGFLDASVGDYDGDQFVVGVKAEHLFARHAAWGFGAGYSTIDVNVDSASLLGTFQADVAQAGVFLRGRL